MPYSYLLSKAQNDPLGPNYLKALTANLGWLRWIAGNQHIQATGEHNTTIVPRVCRRISGTTVSPASSDITAVTNPATGKYVLTLAGGRFTTDLRVQINAAGDATKPHTVTWRAVSATSLEVYIHKLTSTLGVAGNTWAAANSDFDIAIHSEPLALGTWNALPVGWSRGDFFDHRTTGWNTLVQESAELQKHLIAEHTAAGEHNVRQVAKYDGRITWDGAIYRQGGFSSIARTSAGIITVDYPSLTTPINSFICVDYARTAGTGTAGDWLIANVVQTSGTRVTVYIYQWDTTNLWWQVADSDFFLAVHGD